MSDCVFQKKVRAIDYYSYIIFVCWLSLLVLSILVWENNRLNPKEKRLFYLTYILVAITALMEWLGVILNGDASNPVWLLRIIKCADYIMTPVAGAALITNIPSDSIWKKLIRGVLVTNMVFQLVSAFTGWMLIVDEQHRYYHGPLYPVYMILYSILIVLMAIEFITYGNKFRRQNRVSLYSILLLVFICILIQELAPGNPRTAYLGMTLGMIMMFIHITEFSQLASDDTIKEQKVAITTDPLTGISNRYAYIQELNRLEAKETIPEDLTVFSIDINGLKSVNDWFGHAAGDELICGAADCIRNTFDGSGVCYRTGGDEFIVILQASTEQTLELISRLKDNAAAWRGEIVGELYLSAGFARSADYPELTCEKLVIEADLKMNEEKAAYYQGHNLSYQKPIAVN